MTERPILFNESMVRAIVAGHKTQTRRIFKSRNGGVQPNFNDLPGMRQLMRHCPFGQPGDMLWVRETHVVKYKPEDAIDGVGAAWYRATSPWQADDRIKWRPSIHMPRWACRLTLQIKGVRLERLQDISEADAQAEGIEYSERFKGYCIGMAEHFNSHDPRQSYFSLWEAINGPGSVEANPWVWVVEFDA